MRIAFLIHEEAEMPGAMLNWASGRQQVISFIHLWKNDPLPDLVIFDSLVIMGGPMNIYDEEHFPWLVQEKEFIRQSMTMGKKILGICLGSQLLADILGEKVYRNHTSEIGWFPVAATTKGLITELLSGLSFGEPVLHWHGDTFNIPKGAVHLLQSEACPSQAFSYGENLLALQFHFETTPQLLRNMIQLDRSSLIKDQWVMTEQEILAGEQYIATNNQLLFQLLDRFFVKP